METFNSLSLTEYLYELPESKIAKFPLTERDNSKLIVYKNRQIWHKHFKEIAEYLPENVTIFFNNTKVIPARIQFHKSTGAAIEIFLLQPVSPTPEIALAMQVKNRSCWKCMVGNLKKWKNEEVLIRQNKNETLGFTEGLAVKARLVNAEEQIISFEWNGDITFAEMVDQLGEIPLPPYLNRKAELSDKDTYQTIYSLNEGAVAAPTAGLHFTSNILKNLKEKGVKSEFLTLHVGAGTFQPIKEEDVTKHAMHSEQIIISRQNIEAIIQSEKVIAVGTTSMRTLESLYWYGVKLFLKESSDFKVEKLYPYQREENKLPDKRTALQSILDYMKNRDLETIAGTTEIFIFPGYKFRICEGLITNFHQPGSTLILLVAAFIGEDWRKIYNTALENDYRFLSYGDSSLLLP